MSAARAVRVGLGAAFVCALAFAGPPDAAAHSGHEVLRAERYLKLEATDAGLRFVISISYGVEEMLRVARIADEDQDGVVTQREADRYMQDWGEVLRRELPVRVDGSFVRVPWAESFFDPIGRITPRTGTVELSAHVHLMPGRHFVVVTDQMRFEAFDRTDVTFGARDGGTLINAGPSDAPTELVQTLAYGRGADIARVRVLGMTIELPQPEVAELPFARPPGYLKPLVLLPTISIFAVLFARLYREYKARKRGD